MVVRWKYQTPVGTFRFLVDRTRLAILLVLGALGRHLQKKYK